MLTEDQLRLFLVFVAPGFIASRAYRLFSPGERLDAASLLLDAITFSMINFGLTFWVPIVLWQGMYLAERPFLFVATAFIVVLIVPVLLAYSTARLRRSRWARGRLLHPAASAWDGLFERNEERFVLATLQDGRMIGGYYGPRSFASAAPNSPALYLEQTWRVEEKTGALLEPIPGSAGCYLSAADWQSLEFLVVEEGTNVDEKHEDRGDKANPGRSGEKGSVPTPQGVSEANTAQG